MKKVFVALSIYLALTIVSTTAAYALVDVTTPSFPSCTKPQGIVKVSYNEGTHGIAGDPGTYNGKDAVYTLSENTLTQCFCSEDKKSGIQTNWWKVSSLTFDAIEALKKDGWIYVPDGSLWGLDEAPYMAKNANYSCKKDRTVHTDDPSKDKDDDDNKDGEVLGASTTALGIGGQILGLASTGNSSTIYILLGLGAVSMFSAVFLFKNKHQ